MGFQEFDEKMDQLATFFESVECQDGATGRAIGTNIRRIAREKLAYEENVMKRIDVLYEDGMIDLEYRNELMSYFENDEETMELAYPYYEDVKNAKAVSVIVKEAKALSKFLPATLAAAAGYKVLDVAHKKYILARLKRYTLVNPDAISISQLSSERYTVQEAIEKFHINFKYAKKWAEEIVATHCVVYFYEKRPVMTIAYNKDQEELGFSTNKKVAVETVIMDSRFRKHEDYYVAYMASRVQVSHPAIGRVLKQLKSQWAAKAKSMEHAIKESVSEVGIDQKAFYITEAVREKFLTMEDAMLYKAVIENCCE